MNISEMSIEEGKRKKEKEKTSMRNNIQTSFNRRRQPNILPNFYSHNKEIIWKTKLLISQPRKIQFLPTSCWLNFSAPIFFVWLLHIFARTQTKETPSDLCTFDLAIGLFVFLGYFFFLFLLISPHCGYFFLLLSLGSWVFMVNFPSKWMLFCLHSNS